MTEDSCPCWFLHKKPVCDYFICAFLYMFVCVGENQILRKWMFLYIYVYNIAKYKVAGKILVNQKVLPA